MGKESLRGRLGKDDAGRSRQREPSDWHTGLTPTQGERRGGLRLQDMLEKDLAQ